MSTRKERKARKFINRMNKQLRTKGNSHHFIIDEIEDLLKKEEGKNGR